MLAIDRVLFATDFSETSEFALPWAVDFAGRHGSVLHVLHTISLYDADPSVPLEHNRVLERLYERMVRHASDRMKAAVAGAAPPELPVELAQRRGIAPAEAILDYALQQEIDLIVLGSHGHRGVRPYLLGSVAAEVARLAHCPVLVVGREPAPAVKRILVPLDMSEASEAGLEHARELGHELDAALLLLHVIEVEAYLDLYFPRPTEEMFDLPELEAKAVRYLEKRFRDAGGPDVAMEAAAIVAHPVEGIRSFAAERQVDLIVMASHGRTGHQPALIGSVANGVLRNTPCPLLIIKAFGKSLLP